MNLQGIKFEHTESPDANIKFITSNYGLETTPSQEWEFVCAPSDKKEYPGTTHNSGQLLHLRKVENIDEILKRPMAVKSSLRKPEAIGLRLYTGMTYDEWHST